MIFARENNSSKQPLNYAVQNVPASVKSRPPNYLTVFDHVNLARLGVDRLRHPQIFTYSYEISSQGLQSCSFCPKMQLPATCWRAIAEYASEKTFKCKRVFVFWYHFFLLTLLSCLKGRWKSKYVTDNSFEMPLVLPYTNISAILFYSALSLKSLSV